MEDLSPEQIEQLRQQRRAKFEQMGVQPTFSQNEVQQAVNHTMGSKNASARDRINAIKSGAMRETIQELNNAKSPNEFHSIPTPKPRRTAEQQQAKSEVVSKLGLDKVTKKRDLDVYEQMFETDNSYSNRGDVVMGNDWNNRRDSAPQQQSNDVYISEEASARNLGDWENQFKSKVASQPRGTQQPQYQQPVSYQQQYQQPVQSGVDINTMERIINETVDKRMRDLISEVIKLQNKPVAPKNELTYKRVKGKNNQIIENVISIDGVLYKLEELKPRG